MEFLRTTGGLRQRIYQNHLMGNQKGNLRSQLIADGTCLDFERAKAWIQQNSLVQFVVVGDDRLRAWAEYFLLSILRPKHCDRWLEEHRRMPDQAHLYISLEAR
jgi:hypothetical protein